MRDLYKIIVEASPNMIWKAGTDALCDYFNKTWLNFTGRTLQQEMGNGWAEGVHPDDFDKCLSIYLEAFRKKEKFEMEYRLKRYDGEWRWLLDKGTPYYLFGEFQGYIGSCLDVTERKEGELLREMAQMDGLTGVYNRQYFMSLIISEFDKLIRYRQRICMLMIDLDEFKSLNDTFGHMFGDVVLKGFAEILQENVRKFDIIGRFGGDEFLVMLPSTSYHEACIVRERIQKSLLKKRFDFQGQSIGIAASFGLSSRENNETLEELINIADKEMYVMKNKKKLGIK